MLTQRGYSLLEFIIASGLSVSLLMAISQLSASHIAQWLSISARLQLEHGAYALADSIHDELARSGFVEQQGMPLTQRFSVQPNIPTVVISQHDDERPFSCVLYAYDRNRNGRIDIDADDERFGFRLRNQALERRVGGRSCKQNGWHDISEPDHRLTTLEFHREHDSNHIRLMMELAHESGRYVQQISRTVVLHNAFNQ